MVAFYVTFSPIDQLNYLDIIVEFIFAFDMMLRFFHEYKDPESFEIVSDIRRISKKYLKLWFWIDLIAIIPFDRMLNEG